MASYRILLVCTGNICRSPLAEQLLRAELAGMPDVKMLSAGTRALVGAPMTPEAAQISAELGVPGAAEHVGRLLSAEQVRGADLILGMARDHRRAIVELLPRASRTTFTVREFARLAEALSAQPAGPMSPLMTTGIADRLTAAVEDVASTRGTLPPLEDPDDDDVVDPYRQSAAVYAESAAQLVPAVRSVARYLRRSAGMDR